MATLIGELATRAKTKASIAVVGGCAPLLTESVKNPLLDKAEKCRMMAGRVEALLKAQGNAHVVIAARWAYYFEGPYGSGNNENVSFDTGDASKNELLFAQSLRGTVERIVSTGRTVTLIGPVPELTFHLPNAMMKAMMRGGETGDFSSPYDEFARRQARVFKLLAALDALPGVSVVYPHEALCNLSRCRTTTPQLPLYVDDDHLSSQGTKAIEAVLREAISDPVNAAKAPQ
jgi:hypothetical protein